MGLFRFLYGRNLVYNQCWEDPAVDRRALNLQTTDRILAITSAGCNVLDYALSGARVLAVDSNPRQSHLLALKVAGIRALDFQSFFDLFGRGGVSGAREIYHDTLRSHLPEDAQAFWDDAILAFVPKLARGGSFYYSGTSGLFARAVRLYLERVARLGGVLKRLLNTDLIEEQLDVYRRLLRPHLLGFAPTRIVGSPSVLSLVGVPPPQRALVALAPGGVSGYLRTCLDHVMSVALLRENYFWSVYLTGSYDPGYCPEYLKRTNFERLKSGLVDHVTIKTGTVTKVVAESSDTFTVFALLDHMDWLQASPFLLEAEWAEIFSKSAPGARIIFRTGAQDASFLPASVSSRLSFDSLRATALHREDRVGTYGSFHIARLAEAHG